MYRFACTHLKPGLLLRVGGPLALPGAVWLQVMYLRGLRYIYQFNIFLYMMMGIMGISIIINVIKGPGKWKRAKREDAYKF